MGIFTIKFGTIWSGGKPRTVGETIELSEKDRERIDPTHEHLMSLDEAKEIGRKAKAAAEEAAKQAADLAAAEILAAEKAAAKLEEEAAAALAAAKSTPKSKK